MTTSTRVAQLKSDIAAAQHNIRVFKAYKESGTTVVENSDGTYVVDIDDAIADYEYDLAELEYELGQLEEE